jgi:2-polyprenyl-6-hydroxyphenyl methylase/3-demethylubiquinone-9 3-methyltransferase
MLRALMPVDNQLYDRLGDTWWQEDSLLSLLRTSMNPARFGYMRRVMTVTGYALKP